MSNVPDDWASYYKTCPSCGYRTHPSEGYDCKCEGVFRCERYILFEPGTKFVRYKQCDTEVADEDKLTNTFDGEAWCKDCIDWHSFTCGICGDIFPDDNDHLSENATVDEDHCCIWCDEDYKDKRIGHHAVTVAVVEETEETTSERIIRAQIEGGINAKD